MRLLPYSCTKALSSAASLTCSDSADPSSPEAFLLDNKARAYEEGRAASQSKALGLIS